MAARAHIVLPPELMEEIDFLVGPRGRSAFLVETATTELRRRRLLAFLENDEPAWQDASHPELADGTDSWVRNLRQESDRPMTIAVTAQPASQPALQPQAKKRRK